MRALRFIRPSIIGRQASAMNSDERYRRIGICGDVSMNCNPVHIENDRLLICNLNNRDKRGLEALRCDQWVYRHEPTFLTELQGTPEAALTAIQHMDLDEDRQCILGVYEKQTLPH